ncbi:TPA: hypothetical protein EYP37_05275 [Candidatus Poribacteria bacterium]|nr:hypothetical protein [Candidatus Poribacteria bacterium]
MSRFLWLSLVAIVSLPMTREVLGEIVVLPRPTVGTQVYILVQPTVYIGPCYGIPSSFFIREITVVSTGPCYVIPFNRKVIWMNRWRSPIVTYRRWQISMRRKFYSNSRIPIQVLWRTRW